MKNNKNNAVTRVTGETGSSYSSLERLRRLGENYFGPYSILPVTPVTHVTYKKKSNNNKNKGGNRNGNGNLAPVTEAAFQAMVFTYLLRHLPADAMAWATPNADDRSGGHDQASRERRKWKAAQERNKGLVPGIPDLFVLYQGRLTGIELKRPPATLKNGAKSQAKANLSESQQAITPRLEAAGARCFVCRSLDDVQAALTACGVPLERRKDF